jgi:acetyl-CoA carboxylase biotin carboxyl carrier protein
VDIKDIKDLIVTINNTDIETVEIKKSDIQVLITKSKSQENHMVKPDDSIKERVVKEEKENLPLEDEDIFLVESPMVGTYYGAPSPDAAPFVKVGDRVEKGQTLCIIEAMKIMNEIESEISGEIVEILANDEDIVEYGQALMKIRR